MPALDDDELQELADTFEEEAMKSDCIIKRTITIDIPSGEKEELVVVGECKGMRKKSSGGSGGALLRLYVERLGSLNVWLVSTPKGQDVQEGDIVTMEGDDMKVQELIKQTWEVSRDFIASAVT